MTISNDRYVTLTLTENCNLSCIYCYEHNKTRKNMSFETAKKIILNEVNDESISNIHLELFGGEPFLNFKVMKEIVGFVKTSNLKKIKTISTTTNGTLIHNEIQDWLIENRDLFKIGLSLDGTRNMHNLNRSNSFDQIDLDFFKKYFSDQGVKMTVSQQTLPYLFDGVKYCHELGLECNCNLAFGIDWSDESNKIILERELLKLINYYLENPSIKPCLMIGRTISPVAYQTNDRIQKKWCGTSTHMVTYDIDGNSYACQYFSPLTLGKERAEKAKKINFLDEFPIEYLDEKCQKCTVRSVCPTCYGSNYYDTGNIYSKDENKCILTKIIIKARSYFRAKQYELGQLEDVVNNDPIEMQAILRSIKTIQETLDV